MASTPDGKRHGLHALWNRRHTTKFNGVSYPVQRAAEALFSPDGKQQVNDLITHYLGNAKILREAAAAAGMSVYGGINAPYIWVACPAGLKSWELFDRMLHEANVVVTPGAGFGAAGEGYFRISAFNSRENAEEVARRITSMKW
jgi:LL-diaminopimelate aminotransferase